MKQGLVRLLYNFGKRFMGWTLHMIMCVLLCYPVSIHMSQLLSTGRPISSCIYAINGQTKGRNYTNFESNLAMMVMYLPVKFEYDWTERFRVRVRKQKC